MAIKKLVATIIYLQPELKAVLAEQAKQHSISLGELVRIILASYLNGVSADAILAAGETGRASGMY